MVDIDRRKGVPAFPRAVAEIEEACLVAAESELAIRRVALEDLGYLLVPIVISRNGPQPWQPFLPGYQSQIEISLRLEDNPMFPNYSFVRTYPVWTGGKGLESTAEEIRSTMASDLDWLLAKLARSREDAAG